MGYAIDSRLAATMSLFFVLPCCFLSAPPLQAQNGQAHPTVNLVEPAGPLLPKQFGAWQQTPPEVSAPTGRTDGADSTMSVLFEDGLARTATATYKRDASADSVLLHAYQFGDASGAYSAFTFFRTPDFRALADAGAGSGAAQKGDAILVWRGPSLVMAEFHGSHRLADLAPLVTGLPRSSGAKGLAPLLPTLLPARGLESGSVRYALGSSGYEAMAGALPAAIVGFDKSAEVVTAKYAGHGKLTLLLYPTPQIAGEHGRQIEAEMNREGAGAGTVKLRREGPLVLLTTGAWSAEEALKLVEGIHLTTQVTYDKPMPLEFHAEVRKTASLLMSIAELSGALMLAAVVMGLFFGGGRAMLRVLQGKPAATEPEFLRIDLRDRTGEGERAKPLR